MASLPARSTTFSVDFVSDANGAPGGNGDQGTAQVRCLRGERSEKDRGRISPEGVTQPPLPPRQPR